MEIQDQVKKMLVILRVQSKQLNLDNIEEMSERTAETSILLAKEYIQANKPGENCDECVHAPDCPVPWAISAIIQNGAFDLLEQEEFLAARVN